MTPPLSDGPASSSAAELDPFVGYHADDEHPLDTFAIAEGSALLDRDDAFADD